MSTSDRSLRGKFFGSSNRPFTDDLFQGEQKRLRRARAAQYPLFTSINRDRLRTSTVACGYASAAWVALRRGTMTRARSRVRKNAVT